MSRFLMLALLSMSAFAFAGVPTTAPTTGDKCGCPECKKCCGDKCSTDCCKDGKCEMHKKK
jgi:hypothetical protein